MTADWRKPLFYVSAFYDGVLGIAFLFFWRQVYAMYNVTPPNHGGYVQFPALLLVMFGFLFLRIARNPDANRELINYGIGLKLSYSGLVFWHMAATGVPSMWVPFAWLDLGFLILYLIARFAPPRAARAGF